MGMERDDGSIESANTPDFDTRSSYTDNTLYQCMITQVLYIDDINNITKGSNNPQVTYEGVVIGGPNEGKFISNIRDGAKLLGGFTNYEEQVLRAASKGDSFNVLKGGKSPTDQDGDMVYVAFLGGNPLYPVILGKGTQPKDFDKTGAKADDGPRKRSEYNGIFEEVDKEGNYILKRKGGSYDASKKVFTPEEDGNEASLELTEQKAELAGAGGAKIKADDAKVAIGTDSIELLQQISDALQKVVLWLQNTGALHTHIGNLGYPTTPPNEQAQYVQLATDLTLIKTKIDLIKGSF